MTQFSRINKRTQVDMWYSVQDAPIIKTKIKRVKTDVSPHLVKFAFLDGEIISVLLLGHCDGGVLDDKLVSVPNIWVWEQDKWPQWLRDVLKLALEDL